VILENSDSGLEHISNIRNQTGESENCPLFFFSGSGVRQTIIPLLATFLAFFLTFFGNVYFFFSSKKKPLIFLVLFLTHFFIKICLFPQTRRVFAEYVSYFVSSQNSVYVFQCFMTFVLSKLALLFFVKQCACFPRMPHKTNAPEHPGTAAPFSGRSRGRF